MKNLFIMHTQYNLILSAAVMQRAQGAENTLVLHAEFALSDEMRLTLSQVFDRVIVVSDRFLDCKSALQEIRQIRSLMKKVKAIKNESFDNVYMSQERIFDMIVYERAKRKNPHVRCYNIEEDAYYSFDGKYNADNYVYKESKRLKRRKLLYALLLAGYPYNYKDIHYCYGMSSEYHGVHLLYPHLARKELQGKELIEITSPMLVSGIDSIYSDKKTDYPDAEKYTLFFFDLMSRYKDVDRVKSIVREIVKKSYAEGRRVLFKYHPRETDKFTDFEGEFEIPHIIPAEKVLLDLKNKDTVVMGNATTACIVAAKLGFKVISICKIEIPNNAKMHTTMEKMGILCVENTDDIKY